MSNRVEVVMGQVIGVHVEGGNRSSCFRHVCFSMVSARRPAWAWARLHKVPTMDADTMSKRVIEVLFAPANGGSGPEARYKVMTGLVGYVNSFKGVAQRRAERACRTCMSGCVRTIVHCPRILLMLACATPNAQKCTVTEHAVTYRGVRRESGTCGHAADPPTRPTRAASRHAPTLAVCPPDKQFPTQPNGTQRETVRRGISHAQLHDRLATEPAVGHALETCVNRHCHTHVYQQH